MSNSDDAVAAAERILKRIEDDGLERISGGGGGWSAADADNYLVAKAYLNAQLSLPKATNEASKCG